MARDKRKKKRQMTHTHKAKQSKSEKKELNFQCKQTQEEISTNTVNWS